MALDGIVAARNGQKKMFSESEKKSFGGKQQFKKILLGKTSVRFRMPYTVAVTYNRQFFEEGHIENTEFVVLKKRKLLLPTQI